MQFAVHICVLILALANLSQTRIYEPCALARELRYVYGFPSDKVPFLMCLVKEASGYDTSAIKVIMGQRVFGLFQIPSYLFCDDNEKRGFNYCNASCSNFWDDNIRDDVKCLTEGRAYDLHFNLDYKSCKRTTQDPSFYQDLCHV